MRTSNTQICTRGFTHTEQLHRHIYSHKRARWCNAYFSYTYYAYIKYTYKHIHAHSLLYTHVHTFKCTCVNTPEFWVPRCAHRADTQHTKLNPQTTLSNWAPRTLLRAFERVVISSPRLPLTGVCGTQHPNKSWVPSGAHWAADWS